MLMCTASRVNRCVAGWYRLCCLWTRHRMDPMICGRHHWHRTFSAAIGTPSTAGRNSSVWHTMQHTSTKTDTVQHPLSHLNHPPPLYFHQGATPASKTQGTVDQAT